jgi:hypothetical protein
MSDTDTPTTSETILASAAAETDPKALSAAAETSDPGVESPPTLGDLANFPKFLSEKTNGSGSASADHETRLQRLEDELAFLRKMFGWPVKE